MTWSDEVRVFSPDGRLENGERFIIFHPVGADDRQDEIAHFADCIRDLCAPKIAPEDALQALELTLAARMSAQERRRIALP